MSVLCYKSKDSTTETRRRVRSALIHETECLIKLAKEEGISLASLPFTSLSKLELMLLDSAFKQLPLDKADVTLLILPEQYNAMLQKVIVTIVQMLQNDTHKK